MKVWLWLIRFVRGFVLRGLRLLRVPEHVALIMDGNRRFAKKRQLPSAVQGHYSGFDKLNEILEWCLELGVRHVTVYAFSIDNFKRSREEVDALMRLAEKKFTDIQWHKDFLEAKGIRIRIAGDRTLLPPSLQEASARIEALTATHTNAVLTVALAYGSCTEMAQAVSQAAAAMASQPETNGTHNKQLRPITVGDYMWTAGTPPPDICIRTSGETRLSDFLLWQMSEHTQFHFLEALWPELSLAHIAAALLQFTFVQPASKSSSPQ